MEKSSPLPNEILAEDVTQMSPNSSYDDLNDLTLIPNNNIHHQLEKVSTTKTEKYDMEHGGLEAVGPIQTSKKKKIDPVKSRHYFLTLLPFFFFETF